MEGSPGAGNRVHEVTLLIDAFGRIRVPAYSPASARLARRLTVGYSRYAQWVLRAILSLPQPSASRTLAHRLENRAHAVKLATAGGFVGDVIVPEVGPAHVGNETRQS